MTSNRFAVPFLAVLYVACSTVLAQCEPRWLPQPAPLFGVGSGSVRTAANWDPDGDGPAAPVLVVGGRLTNAGERTIGNVSTWNGVDWSPLGYLDNTVRALVEYEGQLTAGGAFAVGSDSGPARGLARWTGVGWEPFVAITPPWSSISALAVAGNDLYVGGMFYSIDGLPCRNIAKWNGESWDALSQGIDGFVVTICPASIGVIAGGYISRAGGVPCRNIALWSGESWQTMGAGFSSSVNTICEFNGDILAGGAFSASGSTQTRGLARWTGSAWEEFGGGATGGEVLALDLVNGDLYASGLFDTIGGTPAPGIARWTGAGWVALADSLMQAPMGVIDFQSRLVTFGLYGIRGPVVAMEWTGDWASLGPGLFFGDAVYATGFDTQLYVSGTVSGTPDGSSGFLRLDNGIWQDAGSATATGRVRTSCEFNGEFVIGGSPRLLLRSTTSGWQPLGDGVDGAIYAMTMFQDSLIIGGAFQNVGGVASRGVAAWTGAGWLAMRVDPPLYVYSLAAHDGELYAGGSSGRVVRWDGAAWIAVADDLNQTVDSLISFQGQLIAAGKSIISSESPANYIFALDEGGWIPLGGGADLPVAAMTEYEGDLIAVGSFRMIGGVPAYGLARWNGSNWSAFPGEINGVINSVAVSDGDLLIAGNFTRIGDLPAPFFARWGSRPVGDLDDDRSVGIQDLANLLAAFGACPGDENYNAAAGSLAGDECVGLADLAVLLHAFGSTCP